MLSPIHFHEFKQFGVCFHNLMSFYDMFLLSVKNGLSGQSIRNRTNKILFLLVNSCTSIEPHNIIALFLPNFQFPIPEPLDPFFPKIHPFLILLNKSLPILFRLSQNFLLLAKTGLALGTNLLLIFINPFIKTFLMERMSTWK